jgi:hypothetical protein
MLNDGVEAIIESEAEPVQEPKQTIELEVTVTVGPSGSLRVVVNDRAHPLASLMFKIYVPSPKFTKGLLEGPGVHVKEYGPVPPPGTKEIEPSVALHAVGLTLVNVAVNALL